MSVTAEKIRTEAVSLSDVERAELAHFLIQSLDPGSDQDAGTAWETELARRAAEIQSGRAVGEPAEKVFAELRTKHS